VRHCHGRYITDSMQTSARVMLWHGLSLQQQNAGQVHASFAMHLVGFFTTMHHA